MYFLNVYKYMYFCHIHNPAIYGFENDCRHWDFMTTGHMKIIVTMRQE